MGAYTRKTVGFDPSQSIVNARLATHGFSVTGYVLQEWEHVYLSFSAGSQWLNEGLVRKITYPSFNVTVPSTNETATSSTSSNTLTVTLESGYNRSFGAFTVEPYLRGTYRDVYIHGFDEVNAKGFQFAIDQQSFQPVDTAVGIRLQYAITPPFGGVIVPYVRAEYHHEFVNGPHDVTGVYVPLKSLAAFASAASFAVPTDKPDNDFSSVAPGFSIVLPHGIQAFAQYQEILGLRFYSDHTISGGVRFEF
jgi:outer membrane autotransporter protein